MATMEEAGQEAGSAQAGSYDSIAASVGADGVEAPRLGFTAAEVVDAALVQDEIGYAARMALSEEAAMRHFGKDPRDLDPRDLL